VVEGGGLENRFEPFRKPYKIQEILLPANGLARFRASPDFPHFHWVWTVCSDKMVTVGLQSTLL
jgi:hypothetical protein